MEVDDPVFASIVIPLEAFVRSLGLSREEFRRIGGLAPHDLANPDEFVPYAVLPRVWTELLRRFPDACLGLRYAAQLPSSAMGVVGYAGSRATNFEESFRMIVRVCGLVDPYMRVGFEMLGSVCRLSISHTPEVERMAEPLEMMVAVSFRYAREQNPEIPRPVEVCFRHPRRHAWELYEAAFDGLRPTFETHYTGLAYPASILQMPLRSADPQVSEYLGRYAAMLLEHLRPEWRDGPLEERVRATIARLLLDGPVDQQGVARVLGMSVRSLQRALALNGTSFSAELDAVRRSRALALIAQRELSVAEIAFALGYSDPRTFARSFRRWTGMTPSGYRARTVVHSA